MIDRDANKRRPWEYKRSASVTTHIIRREVLKA